MRFRRKRYHRRFTPKSRHTFNRKCRPTVLIMRVDANKAYYLRKPRPYRKNG